MITGALKIHVKKSNEETLSSEITYSMHWNFKK